MRFSDQIDLGNGALRNWQAESERLLFDQSARSRWGRGSMERWSVTLLRNPPTGCWITLCLGDAPSSGLFWRSGCLQCSDPAFPQQQHAFSSTQKRQRLCAFIVVSGGIKHSEIKEGSAIKKNIKNHELTGRVHETKHKIGCQCYMHKLFYFLSFFFCVFYLPLYSNVRLFCSCPQENVLSSAASAVPLSPRRATCCVTSSSIQGRNPSNVTYAATPVAGGTPSPAIYAPTRVSMHRSLTLKTMLCSW